MPAKIPWEIIGPAAGAALLILALVFAFIIKMKKLEKPSSGPPSNLNTMSKKSLCFKHEGRISSNETAVGMISEQLKITSENNRQDHKDIFNKLEGLGKEIVTVGKDIITEIKKVNGN